ncbi:hypothetical protein SLEP1_g15563 [Rubroshorea leprosula]|uniref:Transmembrane protein n=1 Tax=Rubroshorea leprosula TaxID=152421 RepID=A0AAV5IRZ9_9ROSI|nr:hypothetical protein SLEP1_g15563 [Rubroshorea leprosula]
MLRLHNPVPFLATTLFLLAFLSSSRGFSHALTPSSVSGELKKNEGNYHGVSHSQSHTLPALPPSGNEGKYVVGFSRGTQRSVVEGPSVDFEPVENPELPLAAQRTNRKDPLNGFKRYTGGWNLNDRHYWASVGYTAAPFFAIALIWFSGFGLVLFLICLCSLCRKRKPYGYSRTAYALSLIFLVLFTIAAILGCVVLYIGQGRFHLSTTETLDYVVNQADSTVDKLRNVSDNLATARQIGVDQVFLPTNVQTDIDQIEAKLNSSASNVAEKTAKNSDDTQDLLDSVRMALIIIAAIMLVLTFLGFLFSIFGMQLLVYILVILGWFLVTGTFILCGTFLLLHNVAGDTCVAMNEWVQNPSAHTAFDQILPCVDKATAQETLLKSKEVTSQLVEVINQVITNVSNINFSPNFKPMYFNQSGPLVPVLCNPFFSDLTDRTCTPGEVNLNNATEVWSNYVCQVSPSGICTTTGRLTPTFYSQMSAVVSVSLALDNYAPFLVQLQDCTFVRETFAEIYVGHCPGILRYSRWIYIGLVMVSTAVMLSLIVWVIYGRERRHRLHTKQFTDKRPEGNKENLRETS